MVAAIEGHSEFNLILCSIARYFLALLWVCIGHIELF